VSREELAALLPDIPRWVEIRSILLAGRGEVLGLSREPLACALADPPFRSAIVVGQPPYEAIGEAAALAGPGGSVIAAPESRDWVAGALPELRVERAVLHEMGSQPRLPELRYEDVRHLAAGEVAALEQLPAELREELREAEAAGIRIAAAIADGMPVAFCYAGSETESLWDIGIDTLEPWRRRGFAARAVAFEVERYRALGKRPVWGAVESNDASRGLAAKLGFVPADELWVFTAPDSPALP
jgi:GNAT superfamily N-acetyltransferase